MYLRVALDRRTAVFAVASELTELSLHAGARQQSVRQRWLPTQLHDTGPGRTSRAVEIQAAPRRESAVRQNPLSKTLVMTAKFTSGHAETLLSLTRDGGCVGNELPRNNGLHERRIFQPYVEVNVRLKSIACAVRYNVTMLWQSEPYRKCTANVDCVHKRPKLPRDYVVWFGVPLCYSCNRLGVRLVGASPNSITGYYRIRNHC